MSNVIDLAEARSRRARAPWEQPHIRTIYECTLDERLYAAEHQLPFVSGLPTQFLSGDWP